MQADFMLDPLPEFQQNSVVSGKLVFNLNE